MSFERTMPVKAWESICAMGGIIDQEFLLEALRGKSIGGIGLDVFPTEPLEKTIRF